MFIEWFAEWSLISKIIITIILLLIFLVFLRWKRAEKYEKQVRRQIKLFDPHCIFYDFNICMDHFHADETPDVAAKAIIHKWQKLNKNKDKSNGKRSKK